MSYATNQPAPAPMGELLPMDRISPRPSLHMAHTPGSLRELAESIRALGLCRPVIVRRAVNGRYCILSGNRRLMACRMLGWPHIPAWVLADAPRMSTERLIDALVTRRLHYLEEADALRTLQDRDGLSLQELAALTGLSRQTIAGQIRLTDVGDELRCLLLDEGVPLGIALVLMRLSDPSLRLSVARRIAQERLCVRDAALLASAAQLRAAADTDGGVGNRENKYETEPSQKPPRKIIGVIRDPRLYVNAIRDMAGQLRAAGVDAILREERVGARMEVTLSIPARRRRAARHQSM